MLFYFRLVCLLFFMPSQGLFSYEVGIACMFRNFGPYVKEWIEYHHMIGVDHFWLYNDASTDNSVEMLKPYIDQGLVELLYWNDGKKAWVPRQIKAYQDALTKAKGSVTWLAMIDSDEFLFPTHNTSLPECLNSHFSKSAGVYANWRNFGTSKIYLSSNEPMLSRLVHCSMKSHSRNAVGKSIIRPELCDVSRMWSPHFCPLLPGYTWTNGEGNQTLVIDGDDLKTDGQHHEGFLRINHYAFRDEKYFQEYRLPRDPNPTMILEQYRSFNLSKNRDIIDFIKKNYPIEYKNYWRKYVE